MYLQISGRSMRFIFIPAHYLHPCAEMNKEHSSSPFFSTQIIFSPFLLPDWPSAPFEGVFWDSILQSAGVDCFQIKSDQSFRVTQGTPKSSLSIILWRCAMKGYNTDSGYMGYVRGTYILFACESEYIEFMRE